MAGGMVVDISEGGLRIDAGEPFPVNSLITVFVQFPRHAVRLRARVTWCSGKDSAKPAMGLAFTKPEPALAKAYAEWIAEVRQAAKEPPADPVAGDGAAGERAAQPPEAPPDLPPVPPRAPRVPEPTGTVRRRLESRGGTNFEAIFAPCGGGWRLTIQQMPRPATRDPFDLNREFPSYAAAEEALLVFVRSR